MMLELRTIVSAPFAENSYVVWRKGSSQAVVFDPGLELGPIFLVLQEEQLEVVAILNTHGHADHIAGNGGIKEAFPRAPLYIGHGDAFMLTDPRANLSADFGFPLVSPPADVLLRENQLVEAAGITWHVLEIPGHTVGHIVYLCQDTQPPCIWVGDVLFRGSIGRYDLPGGNGRLLVQGVRQKLFQLPDETIVYPGHGPTTTIGHEKRANPFVGADAWELE